MTARSAPPAAPRFAALHSRDYRWYYALGLTAMTADNIEHVISYWVIYQKFHSPTLGGFAVISHWVPFLLFSFHAGALADRYDCRRLIQTSQALFMVASIAWGVLFLTDTLQVWHAVVILLIHGAAGVLGAPAQQLIIHDMVGGQHLPSAIRLNASSRYLAILLGPGGRRRPHAAAGAGVGACSPTSPSTCRSRSSSPACATPATPTPAASRRARGWGWPTPGGCWASSARTGGW